MARPRGTRVWARWLAGLLCPALALALAPAQEAADKGEAGTPVTPAQRRQSVNNLKQIVLAMHNHNDVYKQMPAAAWMDLNVRRQWGNPLLSAEDLAKTQGKLKGKALPLLSWRVALLPFLEEQNLYKEFKLDEPWDSEHNKKLIAKIPSVYAPVRGKTKEPGMTYYQVFVGKEAPFNGMVGPRIPATFTDGTSNTFLVVEAGEAVPWTKPQDIPYDAGKPLPKLGGLFPDGYYVGIADGSIRFVPRGAAEKAVRAAITPNGGEAVELPGRELRGGQ